MNFLKNKVFLRLASAVILCLPISMNLKAQTNFPILLSSNGADVHIESMDVDNGGDIYVTGRIGSYNQFTFGPSAGGCGWNVNASPGAYPPPFTGSGNDFFAARFHPDPTASLNRLVWMVVGRSSINPSSLFSSGKDIEVDSGENAYVVGSMQGAIEVKRVYPGPLYPSITPTCSGSSTSRFFVLKIDANGAPSWIADMRTTASTFGASYGEAVALDEGNNRLFVGGYTMVNGLAQTMIMRNGTCTDQCSFLATPTATGNQGFIGEYTMSGMNMRGDTLGERVMALALDKTDSEHVWATGGIIGTDLNVMLADVFMDVVVSPCINFSASFVPIWGAGEDLGLDIAFSSDNVVMLTGAYTNQLNWTFGTLATIGFGNTDIFVGRHDVGSTNFITTSSLPWGVPSTVISTPYYNRTSCIGSDDVNVGSNRVLIGYDATSNGRLESQQISSLLSPSTMVSSLIPMGGSGKARAMEIEYSILGAAGDRYFAGDFLSPSGGMYNFNFCTMGSSSMFKDGFVTRMNSSQIDFITVGLDESELLDKIEIYPNPTDDNFTINLNGSEKGVKLTLYSSNGIEILSDEISAQEQTIDVSHLSSGVYFAKLSRNESTITKKIVIE